MIVIVRAAVSMLLEGQVHRCRWTCMLRMTGCRTDMAEILLGGHC
jgi:hypothetical protein